MYIDYFMNMSYVKWPFTVFAVIKEIEFLNSANSYFIAFMNKYGLDI